MNGNVYNYPIFYPVYNYNPYFTNYSRFGVPKIGGDLGKISQTVKKGAQKVGEQIKQTGKDIKKAGEQIEELIQPSSTTFGSGTIKKPSISIETPPAVREAGRRIESLGRQTEGLGRQTEGLGDRFSSDWSQTMRSIGKQVQGLGRQAEGLGRNGHIRTPVELERLGQQVTTLGTDIEKAGRQVERAAGEFGQQVQQFGEDVQQAIKQVQNIKNMFKLCVPDINSTSSDIPMGSVPDPDPYGQGGYYDVTLRICYPRNIEPFIRQRLQDCGQTALKEASVVFSTIAVAGAAIAWGSIPTAMQTGLKTFEQRFRECLLSFEGPGSAGIKFSVGFSKAPYQPYYRYY